MRSKKVLYILIALLLVLNVAGVSLYLYNYVHKKGDKAVTEAPPAAETVKEDEEDSADEDAEYREPLIAVVDYDTRDAKRVKNRMKQAGLKSERVGSIEELDVDKYDAIVIPGGNSVDPSMYDAERDPTTTDTDPVKDEFQFEAVRMYIEAGKPVLGICRGEQLVNNVLGGTTIQDMPEGWHKRDRTVRIAEGTLCYDLFGTEETTYHYHHQCVDELGDGLYATQWDVESGHIEAYEHKTLPIYGIQWHPDSMAERGAEVFAAFGDVVRENMGQGERIN